jgi:hypothetical protein
MVPMCAQRGMRRRHAISWGGRTRRCLLLDAESRGKDVRERAHLAQELGTGDAAPLAWLVCFVDDCHLRPLALIQYRERKREEEERTRSGCVKARVPQLYDAFSLPSRNHAISPVANPPLRVRSHIRAYVRRLLRLLPAREARRDGLHDHRLGRIAHLCGVSGVVISRTQVE